MKLTNRMGLPQAIVEAVRNDPYDRGRADISITQLIGPPRKTVIEERFAAEISEDASDRIWSLLGQAVHTILERANHTGTAEQRFFMPIAGWTVSGALDGFYADGLIQDYKVTSAWSAKGGVKEEWEAQLNCQRVLLEYERPTIKVSKLQIVAILRDWRMREALDDPGYPQAQVVIIDVPLWTYERALAYMAERVTLHKQARVTLPECTASERWEKAPKWALMKIGGKRAVKLYDTEDDARAHAAVDPVNTFVEIRPGEATRCRMYCNAFAFCTQANPKQPDGQAPVDEIKESVA